MVDEHGEFEGIKAAFIIDALACTLAGLMGLSPLTVFIGKCLS